MFLLLAQNEFKLTFTREKTCHLKSPTEENEVQTPKKCLLSF